MPVLVRQRPAIGDAILLQPTITKLAETSGKCVDVVTDPFYASGGLVEIFRMIPGVGEIIPICMQEWTTPGNAKVDPRYHLSAQEPLPFALRGKPYLDANAAYIEYERQYSGTPPTGIREFWYAHFGFGPVCPVPYLNLPPEAITKAKHWATRLPVDGLKVGLVMRAGDPVRDWDDRGLSRLVVDYLQTSGHTVVSIDPTMKLDENSIYGQRITDVAARLQHLDVVITPDTGILHLANAVGVPTIALWGILPPELRVSGYNTVVTPNLGHCGPEDTCYCWRFQRYSCLRKLTVAVIARTFEEWVKKHGN